VDCERSEQDGGDQLLRVACACAARGKQPVHRTSPPSRWLRQRATSPTSLRSVEEEFRNTPPLRRGARSRRSSGTRLPDVAALGRGGVPEHASPTSRRLVEEEFRNTPPRRRGARSRRSSGTRLPDVAALGRGGVPEHASPTSRRSVEEEFRSVGTRDLDVERSGTPPHGSAVGRCRLARRGDGGEVLLRVACEFAVRGESRARIKPPRWSGRRAPPRRTSRPRPPARGARGRRSSPRGRRGEGRRSGARGSRWCRPDR